MKKVVILGAGFAAQKIISILASDARFSITLISDVDYVTNKPLFPDVAGGTLSPDSINYPLNKYAERYGIIVVVDTVTTVDYVQKCVFMRDRVYDYDYLVIATGVRTNKNILPNIETAAYMIDSYETALQLRKRLDEVLASENELCRIVIVGGGYTGIEYASHVICTCRQQRKKCSITIIESRDTILNMMPPIVRKKVAVYLQKRGVTIRANANVTAITKQSVILADETIDADIVVWTAGMTGAPINTTLGLEHLRGRIIVDDMLRAKGCKDVFVAGDAVCGVRMAVPIAKQHGAFVAQSLRNIVRGKKMRTLRVIDFGYIICLADYYGIGKIAGVPMRSIIGYLFHYMMCCFSLHGWRNKVSLIKKVRRRRCA